MGADGMEHVACSVGTGPVDSAYKAVDLIVKVWNRKLVTLYSSMVFSSSYWCNNKWEV